MVSAPARASSISARRIVALADEFLLLRAQMSAMQRQFESVLAEIAMELAAEPLGTDVQAIVSQRPGQQDNRSDLKRDATLGGTTAGAKAVSTASIETTGVVPHSITPQADELEAEMSDNSSDALTLIRDTRAIPQTAPMRADDQAQSTETASRSAVHSRSLPNRKRMAPLALSRTTLLFWAAAANSVRRSHVVPPPPPLAAGSPQPLL